MMGADDTNRRRFLTGAATAAIIAAPMPAMSFAADASHSAWTSAVAHFNAARNRWYTHPYAATSPADPNYQRLDRENSLLIKADRLALDRAFHCRAPDFSAAVEKLDIYFTEYMEDNYENDEPEYMHLKLAIEDLRRLVKQEAA